MATFFQQNFVQDLRKPIKPQYRETIAFTGDAYSNVIAVDVLNDGAPASLAGNAVCHVIRADGQTVIFPGSVSANQVSAALPAACFAVAGPIAVLLQLVDDDIKTTLLRAVFSVVESVTGDMIDPGGVVPDIDDLLARLEQMEQATNSALAATTYIAPAYNAASTYSVGQYVIYDGRLYVCCSPIITPEAWTPVHWLAVDGGLGRVVSSVRSELSADNVYNYLVECQRTNASHNGVTYEWDALGNCSVVGTASSASYCYLFNASNKLPQWCVPGRSYWLDYSSSNVRFRMFAYSGGAWASTPFVQRVNSAVVTIPADASGLRIQLFVPAGTAVNEIVTPRVVEIKSDGQKSFERGMIDAASMADVSDVPRIPVLQEALSRDNNLDMLLWYAPADNTDSGVTYTWAADGSCSVVGAATATSRSAPYYNSASALPDWMRPGAEYTLVVSAKRVNVTISVYDAGGTETAIVKRANSANFVVPQNAVGATILLTVDSGVTVDEIVHPRIFAAKSADERSMERALIDAAAASDGLVGLSGYARASGTNAGVTYTWTADGGACHISGTATAASLHTILDSRSVMPPGLQAGGLLCVDFASTSPRIAVRVYFYRSNGTFSTSRSLIHTGTLAIPADCVGIIVRYYVGSGVTLDGYATVPLLTNASTARLVQPTEPRPRYLVSIIDDDTSSDLLVDRYATSMLRNGIVGAYAVITKPYMDGDNDISKLLSYQAKGFTMIPHCQDQKRYLDPRDSTFDRERALENYNTHLHEFGQLGLNNGFGLWIIPYGRSDAANQSIAQDLQLDMAWTTDWDSIIYPWPSNPYTLKRNGFSPINAVTNDNDPNEYGTTAIIKARVGQLLDNPDGGWLVVTTHFNDWSSVPWDSTVDATGYEVGYERLNALIQYIKAQPGIEIVSMAQGAAYYRHRIAHVSTNA